MNIHFYGVLLLVFVLGSPVLAITIPSADELKERFTIDMPRYWKLNMFNIESTIQDRTRDEDIIIQGFSAEIEVSIDIFMRWRGDEKVIIVAPTLKAGEKKAIRGIAESHLKDEVQNIELQIEWDETLTRVFATGTSIPIRGFFNIVGYPLDFFRAENKSNQIVLKDSAQELEYWRDQALSAKYSVKQREQAPREGSGTRQANEGDHVVSAAGRDHERAALEAESTRIDLTFWTNPIFLVAVAICIVLAAFIVTFFIFRKRGSAQNIDPTLSSSDRGGVSVLQTNMSFGGLFFFMASFIALAVLIIMLYGLTKVEPYAFPKDKEISSSQRSMVQDEMISYYIKHFIPPILLLISSLLSASVGYFLLRSAGVASRQVIPRQDYNLLSEVISAGNDKGIEYYIRLSSLTGVTGVFTKVGLSGLPLATIMLTIAFTILALLETSMAKDFFDLAKLTLGAFIGSYVQRQVAERGGTTP